MKLDSRLELAEISDSVTNILIVNLVQRNTSILEGSWADGADIVGSASLVVEGHLSITLEVSGRELA